MTLWLLHSANKTCMIWLRPNNSGRVGKALHPPPPLLHGSEGPLRHIHASYPLFPLPGVCGPPSWPIPTHPSTPSSNITIPGGAFFGTPRPSESLPALGSQSLGTGLYFSCYLCSHLFMALSPRGGPGALRGWGRGADSPPHPQP